MTGALLIADAVVAGYVPGMPIVQGVSVTVAPAEIVTIIGPNGAGKSTFLKALAGLVGLEGGRVGYDGRDVTGLPAPELIRAGIGFVPQTGNVFATLTIEDNLKAGAHLLTRRLMRARIEGVFARFPVLAERRAQPARVLSGGERQMLAVARALITEPKLVMLDEPTAGLAPKVVREVFADLRRLAEGGVAVLMVEQNAKAALAVSDRGYVLAEGRNRAEGIAGDLLRDPDLGKAFLGAAGEGT